MGGGFEGREYTEGEVGGDKEEQFMDLVQQLADMIGVDVEMDDGDAAADAEMDMDMGDDVDSLEGGDDLGDEAALDDEDEMDDMGEEEPGMRYMEGELDQDAVVNEVAKRVSTRLQQESKKQEIQNQVVFLVNLIFLYDNRLSPYLLYVPPKLWMDPWFQQIS